jgi:hypothetical protein
VFRAWLDAQAAAMPARKESTVLRAFVRTTVAELEAQASHLAMEAQARWWDLTQMERSESREEKMRRRYETMYRQTIRRSIRSMKTLKDIHRMNAARSEDPDEPAAAD